MPHNHSTKRSERIHQFLRGCLIVACMLIALVGLSASGGSAGAVFAPTLETFVSMVAGAALAYVLDWIMWAIAEGIGGENGLLSPATV